MHTAKKMWAQFDNLPERGRSFARSAVACHKHFRFSNAASPSHALRAGTARAPAAVSIWVLLGAFWLTGVACSGQPSTISINPESPRPPIVAVATNLSAAPWVDAMEKITTLVKAGDFATAQPLHKRLLAVDADTGPEAKMNLATALHGLAKLYLTASNTAPAEALCRRAVVLLEKAGGAESPELAQPLALLGKFSRAQGDREQSRALYQKALAAGENLGLDTPEYITLLSDYTALLDEMKLPAQAEAVRQRDKWKRLTQAAARALTGARDPAQAELQCREAMQLAQTFGPTELYLSRSQIQMAQILHFQGTDDQAEQMLQDALASSERAVGPDHSELMRALEGLQNLYELPPRRAALMVPICARMLRIVARAPHRDDTEVARRARNLASVHQELGDYVKAEPLFQQALTLAEKQNDDVPGYLASLAEFYRVAKKCESAEATARRALTIREAAAAQHAEQGEQLDLAASLDVLARICLDCQKPGEAESSYARSLALGEKIVGPDSTDLVPRLIGLAEALQAQGKTEPSEVQLKRALALTETSLGSAAPELVAILEKYAAILKGANRPAEASGLLARADTIRKGMPQ